jgi:hypothetical protein
MADPFRSSRYSLDRAKGHIQHLKTERDAWFRSNPYAKIIEPNAEGTEDIHKVRLTQPMPVAIPGIAVDALNNLRSALDQAGYAVAIAASTTGKKAHFPFGKTLTEVQSRITGTSKHIPKEIFDVMVAFQPYEGGNAPLWAVNELCNTNKHEDVVPALFAAGTGFVQDEASFGAVISYRWPPQWDSAKQEMEICRISHGATVKYHLTIQPLIVFSKIKGIGRAPVVGLLTTMLREVDRVVVAIEAESRRIGLFV